MTASPQKRLRPPKDMAPQPIGRHVVIGIVAFVLQVVVAPNIAIAGIAPNFLVIGLIIIALTSSQRTSTVAGFVLGLLFDLLGSGPVGSMALVMAIVGFASSALLDNLQADNLPAWLIIAAIICLATNLVLCIVLSILGYEPSFFGSLVFKVIPWTLYDIVICAIAWPIVRRLNGTKIFKPLDSGLPR